jgi:hypothetical protein
VEEIGTCPTGTASRRLLIGAESRKTDGVWASAITNISIASCRAVAFVLLCLTARMKVCHLITLTRQHYAVSACSCQLKANKNESEGAVKYCQGRPSEYAHQDYHLKKAPWSESASELYRPRNRRLSAKWLPTFADKGCHVVSVTDPYGRILGSLDRSRYFSIKQLLSCTHEAEWTPFQTHYFFFLVVSAFVPGPPDL